MNSVERRELTLVVLAAGMGSRFGGAKQVEGVGPNGEILLDYSVYDALEAGFSRVVFVVREEVEAVLRQRFAETLASRCRIDYVPQRLGDLPAPFSAPSTRTKPWGTGQAVLACRDVVSGPFTVLNADDFYGADAFRRAAAFLSSAGGPATARHVLVGYDLAATLTEHGAVSRGVCEIDARSQLSSIVERHGVARHGSEIACTDESGAAYPLPRDAVASMNFWGLDPSLFPALEREFRTFLAARPGDKDEFRLPTAIGDLLARGEISVRVVQTSAAWIGVTHRNDLLWVRAAIAAKVAAGEYPSPLW